MWLNKNRIENILSITQLEEDVYHTTYKNIGECNLYTSDGVQVTFAQDVVI